MTNAQSFIALPADIRATFDNVASGTGHTAYEWFITEIPASIRDNADAIRVLLDGGSATMVTEIGDRGVGGGGYTETSTVEFPDRDFSRHTSGHNGGEYTPDNVTLESSAINRGRQPNGADMTADEIDTAQTALETDASILADADIIVPAGETVGETVLASTTIGGPVTTVEIPAGTVIDGPLPMVETGGSVLGDVGDAVLDGLLPATVGFAMGKHVADQFDDDIDKIGFGSMAMGGTVLACMTPPGQIALAGYAIWNVAKLAKRGVRWISENA